MVTAFCPGHITCFFRPAGNISEEPLSRGSIGAGIRTALGATVDLMEISGSRSRIMMDGCDCSVPVTESVLHRLAPGRSFDIDIENGLPCGEGFGMSAAGAVALALALSSYTGSTYQEAFEAAHIADIEGGGGLGDVSAIYCLEHQPVRVSPGLPPRGKVVGTNVSFTSLSMAVLGPKVHTGNLLGDPEKNRRIVGAGSAAVSDFLANPTKERLFSISNVFSANAGVESDSVSVATTKIRAEGFMAAMCMLGNSIFSDMPSDELKEVVGESVEVFECPSTDAAPCIIRRE